MSPSWKWTPNAKMRPNPSLWAGKNCDQKVISTLHKIIVSFGAFKTESSGKIRLVHVTRPLTSSNVTCEVDQYYSTLIVKFSET